MKLASYGASYEAGDLVKVRFKDYKRSPELWEWESAVVLDYFPSNVYEGASYLILHDGITSYIDAKNVFKSDNQK